MKHIFLLSLLVCVGCGSAAERELEEKEAEVQRLKTELALKEKEQEIESLENQLAVKEGDARPSKAECEEFADKFVELMFAEDQGGSPASKALGAEVRGELVDDCQREGTRREVDCVLAASSMDDVEAKCK